MRVCQTNVEESYTITNLIVLSFTSNCNPIILYTEAFAESVIQYNTYLDCKSIVLKVLRQIEILLFRKSTCTAYLHVLLSRYMYILSI